MTAAFQYDEPEVTPTVETTTTTTAIDVVEPAVLAMSMINNGPTEPKPIIDSAPESTVFVDTMDDVPGMADAYSRLQDDQPEPTEYGEEEYAELCRQADEEYALELQQLETEYAQAGCERAKIQDDLKSAKGTEKLLLESIRKLQADGPDYPSKTKPKAATSIQGEDQSASQSQSTIAAHNSDVPHADPTNLVGETPEHEAYYETPTAKMLDGIEGLGAGKLSSLVEVAPTTRDLVQLQIQAGRFHHGGLHEVLPKGFGKALGERIDQRLIDRMPLVVK